ncbi:pas fold-4 [Lucifera butyrica]|uniref:histidine kinase n=1 Tax=Lucifera butyrica TaxID=1351585 RepID=A0A498R738_9FIRM|nr:ATP-binding protein [Lucifera butyrica]VBB06707.1 pas fold-4 [Lucifera butyrica]
MLQLIQEYIEKLKKVDEQLERLTSDRNVIETELTALSNAINNQSESFGRIISFSHDCVFILDRNCRFTYASISGAQLFGLKQMDMIGKNWRELKLSKEMMIPFEAYLKTVFMLGIPTSQVTRAVFPYGIRYLEYFLNPVFNKHHVVDAVFSVVRDVTQRKESETVQKQLTIQYLDESQRLQQMIDTAPMAILTVDRDGFIIASNQLAAELLPDITDKLKMVINSHLDAGGLDDSDEALIARALNGEEINGFFRQDRNKSFLISAYPIKEYNTDNIVGAIAYYQDISELENLRNEYARLDRLKLIGEMAAGVAHEIRNPMTVVKGYLQVLTNKAEPDLQERYSIIMNELNRIDTIVTDFLSLARNKTVTKEICNLNNIIAGTFPLLQADAAESGIEIKLNLAEVVPELLLNEKEIKQVLFNLSRNSIQAMQPKGLLRIETKVSANAVKLIVADNGCGIEADYLNKIFDPFFTTKDTGTGLGLAICQSIVERHAGKIEVQSKVGKGTSFFITFPTSEKNLMN